MKVLIFNGSPKINGNTNLVAQKMKEYLERTNIEVEICQLAQLNISHCLGCEKCYDNKNMKCVIEDDLNELFQKAVKADALILGSPVHFSSISGLAKKAFDRLFYLAAANGGLFRNKVGACFVVVRRSGGSLAFHTLNAYLTYSEMIIPGGNYWTIIHGELPLEAQYDVEGLRTAEVVSNKIVQLLENNITESLNQYDPILRERKISFIRDDLKNKK